jgi:hypothetical protein
VSSHAALCLVKEPDDLIRTGWRIGSDDILQVITQDKVGAMLL